MATQPNLKVSDAKKRQEKWYHNAIDWYIDKAVSSNNKTKTREALRVANGIISTSEFKKVMQPFSSINEELKNLPGEIREIDFVTPIREKNMGEYIILPYTYFVTVENPDTIIKRDINIANEMFGQVQTLLVKYVESIQQGVKPEEIDPKVLQEKAGELKQEFFDDMVIQAQHTLDFINNFNNFDYKRINGFSDWWMTQEVYTYRYIQNGELYTELLDVANCYPIENNNDFVEDYDGFVYRQRITFQEFEQHYANQLTKEEYDYFTNITNNGTGYSIPIHLLEARNFDNVTNFIPNVNNEFYFGQESLELWRIHFVAPSNVVELTYTNKVGIVQVMHVDNKYELNPDNGDIKLTDIWIPKVYEALRFGGAQSGVYVAPKPCLVQRYDKQSNTVKLPIGGKKGLLRGLAINPIPIRLKDYMIIDRILLLAIERTIAKFREDLLVIPQAVLNPDKAGSTIEKYQHMLADNMLIYDETKVDAQLVLNGIRHIARSNISDYINSLWQLRQYNKRDALDVANMNQERLGNTLPGQTATGSENNLLYAKLGSILMITIFNEILEKDHVADLEFSKFAYINGKQATYFDKRNEEYVELNINPIDHFYNNYGVSVSNSKVNSDIMNEFKKLAFSAAQNGDFNMASIAITANTPKEISKTIDLYIKAKRKYEDSIKQQELQIEAEKNKINANKQQLQTIIQDKKDNTDIKVAEIMSANRVSTSTNAT